MDDEAFDDRPGVIWFDGEMVQWKEANVHVLSHAMHYASAVFEGERCYGGEIFELRQHTERFFESAQIMDFEIPSFRMHNCLERAFSTTARACTRTSHSVGPQPSSPRHGGNILESFRAAVRINERVSSLCAAC